MRTRTIVEEYRNWLEIKEIPDTYENFIRFYSEIKSAIMTNKLTGDGATSVTLRKRFAKQKGLLKLDNKVESYYKRMLKEKIITGWAEVYWIIRW